MTEIYLLENPSLTEKQQLLLESLPSSKENIPWVSFLYDGLLHVEFDDQDKPTNITYCWLNHGWCLTPPTSW